MLRSVMKERVSVKVSAAQIADQSATGNCHIDDWRWVSPYAVIIPSRPSSLAR
jgi:hypothetical protein